MCLQAKGCEYAVTVLCGGWVRQLKQAKPEIVQIRTGGAFKKSDTWGNFKFRNDVIRD